MTAEYEPFGDSEPVTDEEIRVRIREELAEQPAIDTSHVEFDVADGRVTVSGRVGTEGELQVIEHVLTDRIGLAVRNDLVIDESVRIEQPEAADDANMLLYGSGAAHGGADRTEDSAEHLLEDTVAEQYGTDDPGEAAERGYTWNPPDTPVQEGTWNRENH